MQVQLVLEAELVVHLSMSSLLSAQFRLNLSM